MTTTIKTTRKELTAALAAVDPIAKRAPRFKRKIRINANGAVTLAATDFEDEATAILTAESDQPAGTSTAAIVDLADLAAAAKGKGADFIIQLRGNSIDVNGARIPTEPTEQWPAVDHQPRESWRRAVLATVQLSAVEFGRLIRQTAYACDTDSSRYALGGVLFEFEFLAEGAPILHLVASDGRRLAHTLAECAWLNAQQLSNLLNPAVETGRTDPAAARWIVPVGQLKAIAKAAGRGADILIEFCADTWAGPAVDPTADEETKKAAAAMEGAHKRLARFAVLDKHGAPFALYSILAFDGRFPQWRDVFPKYRRELCAVDADVMRETAAELARLAAGSEIVNAGFQLLTSGRMIARYKGPQRRGRKVITTTGAERYRVQLDPRYVAEFCESIPGAVFSWEIVDQDRTEQNAAESAQVFQCRIGAQRVEYILMPMSPRK